MAYACQPGASAQLFGSNVPGPAQFPFLPNQTSPMQGMGLFDGGLLNFSQYGMWEWLIVGGVAFLALGGTGFLGGHASRSGRRRKLQLARAQYELARAKA